MFCYQNCWKDVSLTPRSELFLNSNHKAVVISRKILRKTKPLTLNLEPRNNNNFQTLFWKQHTKHDIKIRIGITLTSLISPIK